MAADIGQSFGKVDQAVNSITTVQEYIQVGIEITNEVAMDCIENTDKGRLCCNYPQSEKQIQEDI